ncbi:MAG TPA: DnaA N-terminal domain-containing protein [Acidimicrobiia bacterium]|nr:DnaA N-terminal domain-containing protein [Acidimicrobiia bacterium]
MLRDFVDDVHQLSAVLLLSTPVDAPVEKHLAPEPADDLWQVVSHLLRDELGDATYRTWLAGVRALDLHNGVLRLSVPHQVARQRIETAFAGAIAEALRQVTDTPIDIELVVETAPRDTVEEPAEPIPAILEAPVAKAPLAAARDESTGTMLHPHYTFEEFVIGASNRFAHAAAMSVAEKPTAWSRWVLPRPESP